MFLCASDAFAQSASGVVGKIVPAEYAFTVKTARGELRLTVDGKTRGRNYVAKGAAVTVIYDPTSMLTFAIAPATPATPTPPSAPAEPYKGKLVRIVTEGQGEDAESARQAALRNAVEEALGVFVDAETLIQNDELVKNQILTFARGDIQSSRIEKQWRDEGLINVRIEALVQVDNLENRVAKAGMPTQAIPTQALLDQLGIDARASDDAQALLTKYLGKYGTHTFVRPEILDQKKSDWRVTDEGTGQVSLQVRVGLKSNLEAWSSFSRDLTDIIKRTKGSEYGYIPPFTTRVKKSRPSAQFENQDNVYSQGGLNRKQLDGVKADREKRSKDWSSWLFVSKGFRYVAPEESEIELQWEGFRLASLSTDIFKTIKERSYYLRVALQDDTGYVHAETTSPIGAVVPLSLSPRPVGSVSYQRDTGYFRCDVMWIGPYLYFAEYGAGHNFSTEFPIDDIRISLPKADFAKVTKVVAIIEIAGK